MILICLCLIYLINDKVLIFKVLNFYVNKSVCEFLGEILNLTSVGVFQCTYNNTLIE